MTIFQKRFTAIAMGILMGSFLGSTVALILTVLGVRFILDILDGDL